MDKLMQCSPCAGSSRAMRAPQSVAKAAAICCKGYCQDATGKSCDAWACPNCGALHAWTGSISVEHAQRCYERIVAEEKRLAAKLGYPSISAEKRH